MSGNEVLDFIEQLDSLTNSVTAYWVTALAKINSKTYRAVPALQEWFKLSQEAIVQR